MPSSGVLTTSISAAVARCGAPKQQDLTGSVADWSETIRMVESATKLPLAQQQFIEMNRDVLAMLYAQRGWVYVRLRQTQQALDDVNKAVELSPELGEFELPGLCPRHFKRRIERRPR